MTDPSPLPPPGPASPGPASPGPASPGQAAQVFAADDIYVATGVNAGDGLDLPDAVEAGDIYALDPAARALRLLLTTGQGPRVAEGSALGRPGEAVRMIARYTLMSPDGDKVELLILALVAGRLYALPLSPMAAQPITRWSRSRPRPRKPGWPI
jgi:hypothetical protein